MIVHKLIQGSAEWHAHRAKFDNASDAPAMLGESPYKTRTELIAERATGITKEHDAGTQARFAEGHAFEALARPVAEGIIGEALYPVTGTNGTLGASFDGLTMMEDVAMEHKRLNNEIRACNSVDELPIMYRIQMEQQLMVSEETEKVLFLATNWEGETLIEEKHFWYTTDPALRKRIEAGWAQLHKDVAVYVPVEIIEKPKAEVVIELPALFVHAKGEITTSNMEEYGTALAARLNDVRSIVLVSDQDFANAKGAASMFRDQITKLKAAKEAMLSQTVTIGEAARMMDAWSEDLRLTALQLEKDVEREDSAKKAKMVADTRHAFNAHFALLNEGLDGVQIPNVAPAFQEAIKGKRNYASMQDALDTMLSQEKSKLEAIAAELRTKLAWYKAETPEYEFLFADLRSIISKAEEDFKLVVTTRIKEHKQKEAELAAKAIEDAKKEIPAIEVKPSDGAETVVYGRDFPVITSKPSTVAFKPQVNVSKPTKPSPGFEEICNVLAKHYKCYISDVEQWITELETQPL